jgi:hypothetical protein
MKHAFMSAAQLKAYRVPVDHAFPIPVKGYVVSFMAFYELRLGVSSH